jgi:hypothetical protein
MSYLHSDFPLLSATNLLDYAWHVQNLHQSILSCAHACHTQAALDMGFSCGPLQSPLHSNHAHANSTAIGGDITPWNAGVHLNPSHTKQQLESTIRTLP